MKRFIIIMVAVALIMSVAVPLFAKGKSSSSSGYCVTTGNGRTQTLGGKSGSRSNTQKGLSNASQHSNAVHQQGKEMVTK